MPFGGSAPNKVYTRTDGVRSGAAVCTQAKNASVNDTSELSDVREQDLADAINLLVMRDGGNQPSAALPMNGYNHTNVGVATASTHYARASQVQDSSLIFGGTAGGTANALTLGLTPNITAYAAGLMILFKASADNTDDDVTVNVDGVGDATLFKFDGATKPAVGDIQNGGMYIIIHDGTNFQLYGAISPNILALAALTSLANLTAFAGLTSAADKLGYFTGSGTMSLVDFTSAGRAVASAANAAAQLTALGIDSPSETAVGVYDMATDAEIRAAASGAHAIMAADLETAAAAVALTDAATVAVDWDSGINFTVTLGGNRTLGNPTNGQPGTWRRIQVTQDGTGSRTLAYGNQYVFPGGTEPVLTTAAASVDVLYIYCRTSSIFEVSAGLDWKA